MEGNDTKPLFNGNLIETPFPKLFNEICSMGISGTLTLDRGKVKKNLIFDHGKPARVTSNLLQEVLGRYLVSIEKISQEQYNESINSALETHRLHGDVLIERGLLTGDELKEYLRRQSLEKLLNIFKWTEGDYRFFKKDFMSLRSDFASLPPELIVFMGIKQHYGLDRLAVVIEPYNDDYLYPGSKKSAFVSTDRLTDDERWLIDLADGTKTVKETIDLSPLDFIDSYRLIYAAVITDVLAVKSVQGQDSIDDRETSDPDRDAAAQILATYHEMMTKNYFEILEVDGNAPVQDIKRAYVRLVKEYHPDSLGPGTLPPVLKTANQIFDLVTKAYKVLSNQDERREYTRSLTVPNGRIDIEKTNDIMNAEFQFQKGKVFLKKRDYRSARESFGWANRLVPEEGEYLAYLGWTIFLGAEDKQSDEVLTAVRHLKKAAALNPSLEAIQLFLGAVYKEQKLRDVAVLYFKKALEINPKSIEAKRELSTLGIRDSR
jgi:tetratricopeptide (TPR) repeat protein